MVGTVEYLIAGLLPQVGADLGVPVSTAGQTVTAYALGVVIGGPLVTMATARLPRKGVALGLLSLFAAGSALSAWAPTFTVLLAGRVVSSLSHAAFLALALVTATQVVPAERVGRAVATTAVGFAGVMSVFTYIALSLTQVTGFTAAAVSLLLLAYGAGSFVGNLVAGRLTDWSLSATVRGVFGGLVGVLAVFPVALVWQPSAVVCSSLPTGCAGPGSWARC